MIDIGFKDKRVYCVVKVDERGKYKIRSSLVYKWIEKARDVVVIDIDSLNNDEPSCALLTTFELSVDAKHLSQKKLKSYQDGTYHMVEFTWLEDKRIQVDDWHRQLLKRLHYEWFNWTVDYIGTPQFQELMRKLNREERKKFAVYPSKEEVFRAFEARPDKIKMICIGQDPYTGGKATGLAFGVKQNEKPTPSLLHIEEAIKSSLGIDGTLDYTMRSWAEQGVLLLNNTLTIRGAQTNSHKEYWRSFTRRILYAIMENFVKPVPIILLGTEARQHSFRFDPRFFCVLEAPHPASAEYHNTKWDHRNVFYLADGFLKDQGVKFQWLLPKKKESSTEPQLVTTKTLWTE